MSATQPSAQQPKKSKWVTPAGALFVAVTGFALGFLVGKDAKPAPGLKIITPDDRIRIIAVQGGAPVVTDHSPYKVTVDGVVVLNSQPPPDNSSSKTFFIGKTIIIQAYEVPQQLDKP